MGDSVSRGQVKGLRRSVAALVVTFGLCAAPSLAAAQGDAPAAAKSPAEALFDQGLEDMLAGRYATGCPALEESFRLDPAPGALFTLAECEFGWGHFATAQTHYRDYLDRVDRMAEDQKQRQAQRVEVAEKKLEELEGKVPILTLRLPADAPEGATVKRDGERVAPAVLGRPMPVDPGTYTIVVEAPGRASTERRVTVTEGAKEEVALTLGPEDDVDRPLHPMKIGAIAAGAVGLVGIVGGTVAGAIAISKKGTIDDECVDQRCTPEGLDAVDSGQAAGTASTVLLVLGVAGAGAAVTLWLLAPDDDGGAEQGSEQLGSASRRTGGIASVGLDLAPRAGGGTVGLSLTF